MNFNQITMLSKMKNAMETFRRNHPKFPLFLNAVSQDALVEGTAGETGEKECGGYGKRSVKEPREGGREGSAESGTG